MDLDGETVKLEMGHDLRDVEDEWEARKVFPSRQRRNAAVFIWM